MAHYHPSHTNLAQELLGVPPFLYRDSPELVDPRNFSFHLVLELGGTRSEGFIFSLQLIDGIRYLSPDDSRTFFFWYLQSILKTQIKETKQIFCQWRRGFLARFPRCHKFSKLRAFRLYRRGPSIHASAKPQMSARFPRRSAEPQILVLSATLPGKLKYIIVPRPYCGTSNVGPFRQAFVEPPFLSFPPIQQYRVPPTSFPSSVTLLRDLECFYVPPPLQDSVSPTSFFAPVVIFVSSNVAILRVHNPSYFSDDYTCGQPKGRSYLHPSNDYDS